MEEPTRKIQKRRSPKIEQLFDFMVKDLKAVIEWDQEEKGRSTQKNLMGYLWLHRGILASRMNRVHLSERSLRNTVE